MPLSTLICATSAFSCRLRLRVCSDDKMTACTNVIQIAPAPLFVLGNICVK